MPSHPNSMYDWHWCTLPSKFLAGGHMHYKERAFHNVEHEKRHSVGFFICILLLNWELKAGSSNQGCGWGLGENDNSFLGFSCYLHFQSLKGTCFRYLKCYPSCKLKSSANRHLPCSLPGFAPKLQIRAFYFILLDSCPKMKGEKISII